MSRSPIEPRVRHSSACGLAIVLASVAGCAKPGPTGTDPGAPTASAPAPATTTAAGDAAACCSKEAPRDGTSLAATAGPADEAMPVREVPDVPLLDQDGNPVRFATDLVKGRVVAVNFIFTSCKGICPPLGANFAALSRRMAERMGRDVGLISVSVDPTTDTPQRLKSWSRAFNPGPGWTLVTGEKPEVDRLLKALGVFAADKTNHSPFLLINDGAGGPWTRLHGLTSPVEVAEQLERRRAARSDRPGPEAASPGGAPPFDNPRARRYFTNVRLVDQHGDEVRLYDDLLRDKVVVIQTFFCSCRGACPPLVGNMAKIQERFRDRLGRDLRLLSITVDPANDTPGHLKEYADRLQAKPGWSFLTGKEEDVGLALRRLGQHVDTKEQHTNVFLVGNDRTGLWKKAMGLANLEDLFRVVESVLDDRPAGIPGGASPVQPGRE
jgi:cytochrome oxidase Cu insertion factor (SCO1/SenC/PrrC family)